MVTDEEIAAEMAALEEAKANTRRALERLRDRLAEQGLVLDVNAAYAAIEDHKIEISDFILKPTAESRH